jgi:hypothetical protein
MPITPYISHRSISTEELFFTIAEDDKVLSDIGKIQTSS